ncbi:hypothetical protein C8R45DRAFT_261517 [Mycena sanguinolenta]|nr:hypothetical protein C8R45DRAFT_261517 [Mycena sanguinolenta]
MRRSSSIAMSLGNRNSMTFNASGSSYGVYTPGGNTLFNPPFESGAESLAAGRLSPSIIIPMWAGRVPAFPPLPPLSPSNSGSATNNVGGASGSAGGGGGDTPVSGSVGRRSSVIFGPRAHGREASKSMVRSMPALAMEGTKVEVPAGESDDEDGELEIDEDEADQDQDQEGEQDGDGDEDRDNEGRERGAESPFVPLRLDIAAPLSLDIAGMLGLGGKGKGKERAANETATVSAQPLRPSASQGSSLVGKTPTTHPQAWHPHGHDYFSVRTPTTDGTPRPSAFSGITPMLSPTVRTVPMPPLPAPERPGMYKHASRSMVDILQTSKISDADIESDVNAGKDDIDVLQAKSKAKEPSEAAPAYEPPLQRASTLKRRRSMPEIMAAPPPYTMPLFPSPFLNLSAHNAHPLAQARIAPREDEGREILPPYTNEILLRGVMPRKMEFTAPGVQARDRKWRRVVCELEGTVFRVYRCAGEGWWERRVGAGDVATAGGAVTSAAATVKARATAAAAREGQEANKIAGEGGRVTGVGGEDGEGPNEAEETTELMMPPRSSMSSVHSHASSGPTTPPSPSSSPTESSGPSVNPSRPRFGLGLLKPRSHGRSKSDLPNPPKSPTAPRSSLSIPRPSFGGGSSSGGSSSGRASPSPVGSPLAPSRSNVSLASSSARSAALSARAPMPPSSSNDKGDGKWVGANAAGTDVPEPDPADLIRAYTLQHAESGLGNDYLKRKHVIRVRLEGEQFLLQARDVGDVVDWIEGLHSATNIALDLDERIMPKGPLFPRRRRRRQRPNGAPEAATTNDPPASLRAS